MGVLQRTRQSPKILACGFCAPAGAAANGNMTEQQTRAALMLRRSQLEDMMVLRTPLVGSEAFVKRPVPYLNYDAIFQSEVGRLQITVSFSGQFPGGQE